MRKKKIEVFHHTKKQNDVIIGLGSNIEPEYHIRKAIDLIGKNFSILSRSTIMETEPIGYKNQPNFLNGVVMIQTEMRYQELHRWLVNLENKLKRVRTSNKYGPRTIDLDILVWNKRILDPNIYKRPFLYQAIEEVSPFILKRK